LRDLERFRGPYATPLRISRRGNSKRALIPELSFADGD
jgi:hypothetical protein